MTKRHFFARLPLRRWVLFNPYGYRMAIGKIVGKIKFICAFFLAIFITVSYITYPSVVARSESSLPQLPLIQQGQSLYEAGQFQEAIAVLQQAVQLNQRQGNSLQQAIGLSNLALVYQKLGSFKAATQSVDESLKLLYRLQVSDDRQKALAHTLALQGNLYLEQGQAEAALLSLKAADEIYVEMVDVTGIIRSRIDQAQALQAQGSYRQAEKLLQDLEIHQLREQPDTVDKILVLRSLGHTYQVMGSLEKAKTTLEHSREIAQRLQRVDEVSAVLVSLGNLAKLQQQNQQSISYYQQAAASPILLIRIQARINLFDLLRASDAVANNATASLLLTQISTEIEQLSLTQSSLYARIHWAQSLLKSNATSVEAIARFLAKTIEQAQRLGDIRSESYALGTLGHLYEQTQQWSEAHSLTKRALAAVQDGYFPEIKLLWHWQLGRLLKQQGQIQSAIWEYDAAIEDLQRTRFNFVAANPNLQYSYQDSVEPVYRESVELLLEYQDGEIAESPVFVTASKQNNSLSQAILDKARQRMEDLRVAELSNFFRRACIQTKSVELDKVVDNSSTAIIYPILLSKRLHLIVKIPNQDLLHYVANQPRTETEETIEQLNELILEPDKTLKIKALGQNLYQDLIQPVEEKLQQSRVDSLVFVLDSAFQNLPMAVLYDGQQYLIEKYSITISPGLKILEPKQLERKRLNVLAAGLTQIPPEFEDTFLPLTETESELEAIQKTGIPTTKLLGNKFTSELLESTMSFFPYSIIHLATHGKFSSEAKDTFVLDANGSIDVGQLEEILRYRSQVERNPIELLVLSACQTAVSDSRAPLGLAGIALNSGALSTLASLWSIGDESTAILIGEFYQQLATGDVTKAEALRRAQIKLLKQYPNYSRPSHWAAYVLVGNWF
jgi:CHAT domain-containing protein